MRKDFKEKGAGTSDINSSVQPDVSVSTGIICDSKHMIVKRIIAFVLIVFSVGAFLTEMLLFGMYILPTICMEIFRTTGISIQPGLSLREFSVQDACVMFMMWIVPCVFIIGVSIYGHCKLAKRVMLRVAAWFKLLFTKGK